MPSLFNDFTNPEYFRALKLSIGYGFEVLVVLLIAGAVLTYATGGTQARKWTQAEH